jgi:hypothetical protein
MTEETPRSSEAGGDPHVTESDSIDPAAAFSLLGNELRVDMIRELGSATEGTRVHGLPFAELRQRCDVRDSGRFNYHLQELVGTFVYEDDGAYRLLYPGVLLYEAMQSGSLTDRLRVDPFGTGRDCPDCGAEQTASYRDSLFEVSCPDCERQEMKYTLPPGALSADDPEQVIQSAHVYARRDVMAVFEGVCPVCAGSVGQEIVPPGEEESDLERGVPGPAVVHRCGECGKFFTTTVAMPLVYHPTVIGFFDDHGTNVLSAPPWELGIRESDLVSLASSDPLRIHVEFEAGGERLLVTVDGDLTVLETEREPVE